MKCISVYTKDFAAFSDIYEQILETKFEDHEEKVIEGITVSDAGEVPENYIEKRKAKTEVVVMKDKDITILQHGELFEIFIPSPEPVLV